MAQQTLLARSVTVPPNLEALMHQLTREILRDQPKNLYEFAADFFARLIEQPEDGESIWSQWTSEGDKQNWWKNHLQKRQFSQYFEIV